MQTRSLAWFDSDVQGNAWLRYSLMNFTFFDDFGCLARTLAGTFFPVRPLTENDGNSASVSAQILAAQSKRRKIVKVLLLSSSWETTIINFQDGNKIWHFMRHSLRDRVLAWKIYFSNFCGKFLLIFSQICFLVFCISFRVVISKKNFRFWPLLARLSRVTKPQLTFDGRERAFIAVECPLKVIEKSIAKLWWKSDSAWRVTWD